MTASEAELFVDTPVGVIKLQASAQGLTRVSLYGRGTAAAALQAWAAADAGADPSFDGADPAAQSVLELARAELTQYFAGTLQRFTVPLAPRGTPFQQRIWQSVAEIGWGEAVSYGELAALAGSPRAARAVAGAVGSNRLPIFIGCHRILASAGALGGYSGGDGLDTKRSLLRLEGISWRGE